MPSRSPSALSKEAKHLFYGNKSKTDLEFTFSYLPSLLSQGEGFNNSSKGKAGYVAQSLSDLLFNILRHNLGILAQELQQLSGIMRSILIEKNSSTVTLTVNLVMKD